MPRVLRDGGWRVIGHCPERHHLSLSSYLDDCFGMARPLRAEAYASSLLEAIERQNPDIVLPCEDVALHFAHRLRDQLAEGSAPRRVLDASLAPPAMFEAVERKCRQAEEARSAGLSVPDFVIDPTSEEAAAFARDCGYPVVVKLEFTWGLEGVWVCRTPEQLEQALTAGAPSFRAPGPPSRMVQQFVGGADEVFTFAAFRGEILDGFALRKVPRADGGVSSMVEVIEAPELGEAVAPFAARLGYSGFADVDFRRAPDGSLAFIEMNPRLTPVTHLGRRLGHDLCAALARAFGADPSRSAAPEPLWSGAITLFPDEWWRDPESPHLTYGHHDAPWDEPELLQHALQWRP